MRVIAKRTLIEFVATRVPGHARRLVRQHLEVWHKVVSKAEWKSSAELKQQFSSASILGSERVVFNIKGNEYRLIVSINYDYGIVLIKWIGKHSEYDKLNAREVAYDKTRYSGPTDSK